jgi:hypothetical protein
MPLASGEADESSADEFYDDSHLRVELFLRLHRTPNLDREITLGWLVSTTDGFLLLQAVMLRLVQPGCGYAKTEGLVPSFRSRGFFFSCGDTSQGS